MNTNMVKVHEDLCKLMNTLSLNGTTYGQIWATYAKYGYVKIKLEDYNGKIETLEYGDKPEEEHLDHLLIIHRKQL